MRRIGLAVLFMVFLAFGVPGALGAHPVLELASLEAGVDFSGREVVLLEKGDDPRYREPAWDDSAWKAVSLPSNWDREFPGYRGICWYRVHIRFPAGVPLKSPGILLGTIVDTDEVYFNGRKIGSSGKFSPERVSAYDRVRLYEIPVNLVKPGAENVLAIRVGGLFPDKNGPYRGNIMLGAFRELQKKLLLREFIGILFVIIYLVLCVYFGLFSLQRKQHINKEYLNFSLLTFCAAIYFFLRNQAKYFLFDNFIVMKKIEYYAVIFIFVLCMEFVTAFFKERRTWIHYIFYAVSGIAVLYNTILSDLVAWHYFLHYVVHPAWLIPILYGLYLLIKYIKKDTDARYILIASIVWFFSAVNDILVHRDFYDFYRVSSYVYIIPIVCIGIVIRNRYFRLHAVAEEYKKQEQQKPGVSSGAKDKLEKAISLIGNDFSAAISREEIAGKIGMNPDHFGKMFLQYTGKKFYDYCNEKRVEEASRLLVTTDRKIIDIAYDAGFESMTTFYRIFQKIVGESPTAYRKNHRDDQV
ncbi:MAG: helix-turn-helix domain-containing protein [bacterium]|nr:helix-turn-helix domain-containing protein [bacterium]